MAPEILTDFLAFNNIFETPSQNMLSKQTLGILREVWLWRKHSCNLSNEKQLQTWGERSLKNKSLFSYLDTIFKTLFLQKI